MLWEGAEGFVLHGQLPSSWQQHPWPWQQGRGSAGAAFGAASAASRRKTQTLTLAIMSRQAIWLRVAGGAMG